MSACEDSLKRLGPDYIYLYQIHFDDPEIPIEETDSGYVLVLSLAYRLPIYYILVGQLKTRNSGIQCSQRTSKRLVIAICHPEHNLYGKPTLFKTTAF